jgi:hypothetical protein
MFFINPLIPVLKYLNLFAKQYLAPIENLLRLKILSSISICISSIFMFIVSGNKFDKLKDELATGALKSASQYGLSFLQEKNINSIEINRRKKRFNFI